MEFSYFMPVRLLFGANVIDQLGATAKSYGTQTIGTPDAGASSMAYFFQGLAQP